MLLSWEGQMRSSANSHPIWRMQGTLMNVLSQASASAQIFFPLSPQIGLGLANFHVCVAAEGEQLCRLGMNKPESRFRQRKSKIPS